MTTKYFHTSFKLDWNFVKIPGNYKELVSFFCSVFLCPYWSGALFSCCKPVGNSLVLWAISTTRPSLALSSFTNVKDCVNWCSSCPTAVACWERERETERDVYNIYRQIYLMMDINIIADSTKCLFKIFWWFGDFVTSWFLLT